MLPRQRVVAERGHWRALPLRSAGLAPQQLGGQDVVAVGEDVGLHRDRPADDAADREARRVGDDAIDHHRRAGCRGAGRGRFVALYRIDSSEAQPSAPHQAAGDRASALHRAGGFAQHGAANRIERIQAHRHGLVRGQIVVYQNDQSMLCLPRIGRIEPRQRRHGRRRSRQAADTLRRQAMPLEVGCRSPDLVFDASGKLFRQEQAVGRGDSEPQCTTPRGGVADWLRASATTPIAGATRASESSSSPYQAARPSHQAVEAKTPSRPAPANSLCFAQARPGSMPIRRRRSRGGSLQQSHATRRPAEGRVPGDGRPLRRHRPVAQGAKPTMMRFGRRRAAP